MTWFIEAAKTRYYSQSGEDGVLEEMLAVLRVSRGWFAECGAGDGRTLSNTRFLAERPGWQGCWLEASEEKYPELVKNATGLGVTGARVDVNAENFTDILNEHIPSQRYIDLLSLDIDGNDYWVWKALKRLPRIVCIEYNAAFPPTESRTIEYDPAFTWSGTDYHGASAGALHKLGREKGYTLVAYCGVNLFFVRDEFAGLFGEVPLADVPQRRGHRKDPTRVMIEV